MVKLLILGGTSEAAALAHALTGLAEITSSLAGRAGVPHVPGQVRVGGFGGAQGLEDYLRAKSMDAVIDATHPFAARISAHAETACRATGIPRLVLRRPEWMKQPGDHWIEAANTAEAASLLPRLGKRAFLTVGAGEVEAFAAVNKIAAFAAVKDVWFLVRLLKDGRLPLTDYATITGRPPFSTETEQAVMQDHAIDILVTKASGGSATYAKIAAARALGLPVLMIRRPVPPPGDSVESIEAAVEWLRRVSLLDGLPP